MATTPVEVILPSGLTATLSLYAAGSDTLANSDGADTLTEDSNALGFYTANVTEALDGIHKAKVLVGSNVVANGYIDLADDTTRRYVVDSYLEAAYLDTVVSQSGSGDTQVTIEITEDGTTVALGGTPVADASCFITTSTASTPIIVSATTDDVGAFTALLNKSVQYYLWASKAGQVDIQASPFYVDSNGDIVEGTL